VKPARPFSSAVTRRKRNSRPCGSRWPSPSPRSRGCSRPAEGPGDHLLLSLNEGAHGRRSGGEVQQTGLLQRQGLLDGVEDGRRRGTRSCRPLPVRYGTCSRSGKEDEQDGRDGKDQGGCGHQLAAGSPFILPRTLLRLSQPGQNGDKRDGDGQQPAVAASQDIDRVVAITRKRTGAKRKKECGKSVVHL